MCNWAGKFKFAFIIMIFATTALAESNTSSETISLSRWDEFAAKVQQREEEDRRNGISYMISGSLALIGGIWGASITDDHVERGIYTVFQTIGVASVGYGIYTWKIGGDDRMIYRTLQNTRFSPEYKSHFLKSYKFQMKDKERRENLVRAITHGLISALNIYNGSQQKNDSLRNGLYFIGGINLLAAISFTFDF